MKVKGLVSIIQEQTNLILTHADDYAKVTTTAPLKPKPKPEPRSEKKQVKIALS